MNNILISIVYYVHTRNNRGYRIIYWDQRLNWTCCIRIYYQSFHYFMGPCPIIIIYSANYRYHVSRREARRLRELWLHIKLNFWFSLLNEINFAFGGIEIMQEALNWILLNNTGLNQVLIMNCWYWSEIILKRWRCRNSREIELVKTYLIDLILI